MFSEVKEMSWDRRMTQTVMRLWMKARNAQPAGKTDPASAHPEWKKSPTLVRNFPRKGKPAAHPAAMSTPIEKEVLELKEAAVEAANRRQPMPTP